MATTSQNTAKAKNYGDLWSRLTFLLLALVVYRLGAHIPVPGIDPNELQKLFEGQSNGILGLFNMFSGGALSRFTVFALGIMPYISASIILQIATYVYQPLEALKKEGEAGRRKITQYTRLPLWAWRFSNLWVLPACCKASLVWLSILVSHFSCRLLLR